MAFTPDNYQRLVEAAATMSDRLRRVVGVDEVANLLVERHLSHLVASGATGAPGAQKSDLIALWLAAFGRAHILAVDAARKLAAPSTRELRDLAAWMFHNGLVEVTPVGLGRFLSRHRDVVLEADGERLQLVRREVIAGARWYVSPTPGPERVTHARCPCRLCFRCSCARVPALAAEAATCVNRDHGVCPGHRRVVDPEASEAAAAAAATAEAPAAPVASGAAK